MVLNSAGPGTNWTTKYADWQRKLDFGQLLSQTIFTLQTSGEKIHGFPFNLIHLLHSWMKQHFFWTQHKPWRHLFSRNDVQNQQCYTLTMLPDKNYFHICTKLSCNSPLNPKMQINFLECNWLIIGEQSLKNLFFTFISSNLFMCLYFICLFIYVTADFGRCN